MPLGVFRFLAIESYPFHKVPTVPVNAVDIVPFNVLLCWYLRCDGDGVINLAGMMTVLLLPMKQPAYRHRRQNAGWTAAGSRCSGRLECFQRGRVIFLQLTLLIFSFIC